jgi:DNA-directed RNA polymerase subunit RPC12/RpoP
MKKSKIYKSSWTQIEDPLHKVVCPHCKSTILMSKRSTIEVLVSWAKNLNKKI